ncbi:MAG TPA: ROK family protein [Acidimicrobiales bacterium]|nr:ROK family protein [Acidimicrobiales bacterium]
MRSVLAIDIGGTKLDVGVVDESGAVLRRQRAATARDDPWAALASLIDGVLSDGVSVAAVGVGCGGPMAPQGETVSPLNIAAWRGFPLRARLRELTRRDVFVDNDAKALALGEGRFGAARGVENFMAMVVSTGVGGGIVVDGRVLDGDTGNAGHIGHVIVEPEGASCVCGARGCLEAETSGPSIERLTGRPAAEADAATILRTGTLVGRGIASVVNLLDIRLALVGGSVALGLGDSFFEAAQREVDSRCRIEFARGARVAPVGLGSDGPLVGAGAVAYRALA